MVPQRAAPTLASRSSNTRFDPIPIVKRRFTLLVEKDEDGWFVGTVPELPGCHTQARTRAELKKRVLEAVRLYLDVQGSQPPRVEFVGVEQIEVTA